MTRRDEEEVCERTRGCAARALRDFLQRLLTSCPERRSPHQPLQAQAGTRILQYYGSVSAMRMRPCLLIGALLVVTTSAARVQQPLLVARIPKPSEPTPAAKLLDVATSTARESLTLLVFLRLMSMAAMRLDLPPKARVALCSFAWIIVVQGSARLQGVMQKPTEVLSPDWYSKLIKPAWNPPPWAFPLAWIPLKLAQTVAATLLWQREGLRVFTSPAVLLYVIHITLGDVWNRAPAGAAVSNTPGDGWIIRPHSPPAFMTWIARSPCLVDVQSNSSSSSAY